METQFSTLEQRLALLMEMPTFSDNTLSCQKTIESLGDELKSLGMHVTTTPSEHPHLVATSRRTKKPTLMLVAHLDIVPETNGALCKLVISGDKLTGRGVYDMKFAAACYLELAHELAAIGKLSSYDFGIMFTTDEEIGGEDGVAELLGNGWSAGLAVIPDGGENWQVESAAKGMVGLELTASGRSAHGSRPWEGDNAITRLIGVLSDIQQRFSGQDPDKLTLSINQFAGGTALNQIADSASATIDMRAFTASELESTENAIRATAQARSVMVDTVISGQPVALDTKNTLVRMAIDTLERYRGEPCEYSKSFGATDGRWFSMYSVPSIIVRPNGGDIHGPTEWLLREDLPRFYGFLRQLTEDLAAKNVDKITQMAQTA